MSSYRNLSIIEIRGKPNLVWRNQQGQISGRMVLSKTRERSQSRTTVEARTDRTQESKTTNRYNNNLRSIYRGLRATMNTNLYTVGGVLGANVGTSFAIAQKAKEAVKRVLDVSIDIYSASSGETMKSQNSQAVIDRLFNPMAIVGDVYSAFLNNYRVNRENRGLAYHRRLTGEIVNTKDKGRY